MSRSSRERWTHHASTDPIARSISSAKPLLLVLIQTRLRGKSCLVLKEPAESLHWVSLAKLSSCACELPVQHNLTPGLCPEKWSCHGNRVSPLILRRSF
ncbi:hypothetical protein AV530_002171 [Patagioenas fasciata monilis]|uniref:Uncharacterized protein n=1 Tax=Patagioenas fasciata monilis TaxID=372326 RepID=A0A1V4K5N5_PATFA|nr:hypothetical protein AV530_002171 [Patagioenas fasciata monilis]